MPVLIVYGIPQGISEENIGLLKNSLKQAVAKVKELKINVDQVSCFMPLLHPEPHYILVPESGFPVSEEIIVFIDGLFDKPNRTHKVRNKLAQKVGKVLKKFFPAAMVEVFIRPFDPNQGFWASG